MKEKQEHIQRGQEKETEGTGNAGPRLTAVRLV